MNLEIPDIQTGFRKGRETRDQIANLGWIIEKKKENSRKTSVSASLTMLKPLTMWITTKQKILKEMGNTGPPNLSSEKSVCRSRSNS